MKFLVDSYAWVEYLDGTQSGQKVKEILQKGEIYTLNLVLSEVISRMKRLKLDAEIAYKALILNSKILQLSPEIAKEAGLLHAEIREKIKHFGLVDALLLALARRLKAKILTGDQHFKGFKEAVLIR